MVKLFKVTADYRANNPNKPIYQVCARNKAECRKAFNNKFSWLKIYEIEEISFKDVDKKQPIFSTLRCKEECGNMLNGTQGEN